MKIGDHKNQHGKSWDIRLQFRKMRRPLQPYYQLNGAVDQTKILANRTNATVRKEKAC
jgi:hypothetical protein